MNLNKFHRYINLQCRPERNILTKEQLSSIGIWDPKRYNAYKTTNGSVGCGMSHLSVLKEARDKKMPYILVCEDDVIFSNPDQLTQKIKNLEKEDWDVLLLGGNAFHPYSIFNEDAYRIHKCFTTTAYIVREHYYDTLIECWDIALKNLIRSIDLNYSLDKAWFPLQERDKFLLIKPLSVYQRTGYSDICNEVVSYKNLMLSPDKELIDDNKDA